ncbi:hypothetical protein BPO_0958 [Bergeyella porcorum]|uniref:Uncharacterized protein n=1 Tax=Bergeyella porcorum TaxID=1735111 RepID=A0AAU0EZZ7_9FLAO
MSIKHQNMSRTLIIISKKHLPTSVEQINMSIKHQNMSKTHLQSKEVLCFTLWLIKKEP